MLSWANRVSKNSFRRLVYIVGAHFIYCWITILYIVGAHLYLMLEHISIQSRYFTTHNCHMATTHNLINRTSGSMQDLVCFTAPRHGSAPKNSCLCVARILSYCYHCFLCDCLFMMFVLVTCFSVIYSPNRKNFLGLLEEIKAASWFYFCIFLPYVDYEDPATGDYLLILGSLVASMTWPRRYFSGGHQCMVRTSINLHKKLWPILDLFC